MSDITVSHYKINLLDPDERDQFRQKCLQNEAEFRCYQILNFGGNAIELAKLIMTDELQSIRDS